MYRKMKTIVIATKNKHKLEEIKRIFRPDHYRLKDLSTFPEIPAATENGDSFAANAMIKARYYYKHLKMPVIADDSGLVVAALNGEPGIYSARYAGPAANYEINNLKLLKKLKKFPPGQRRAYFICVAVFWDGSHLLQSEGRIDGTIGFEPRGVNGFGYDPVFIVPGTGKTLAELSTAEKNRISHRFHAFTQMRDKLSVLIP
jgi:XTP/dITP diphosphohydrolase